MKTAAELRKIAAELNANVQAIVELAKEENRELLSDEQTAVDAVLDTQLPEIETQILRAEKLEARAKAVLGAQLNSVIEGNEPSAFTIPARARRHGVLTAFKGEDGEKSAYITGRWLAANFLNHKPSADWLNQNGVSNALSADSNEKGGIFVPVETETSIIRLVEQYGVFRRYAQVTPMASDRKVQPVRTAGMTAYPVAETNTGNEGSNTGTKSEPSYTTAELVARKWKAWLKMSDELNEDSIISMADQVATEMALAFAYAEDNAGFNGDGTSTYHGITGLMNALNAGSIYTSLAGNTAFSTLDYADFEGMAGKLPDFPGISPAWFISKEGYYASMHRLLSAAGGNDMNNLASGGGMTFLGHPVVFTNVLNKVLTAQTSTKILAFGDLRMSALFGDRRGVSLSLTDQRYWDEDQIAIKATERFDINIHSKGTASVEGAILVMATPGS